MHVRLSRSWYLTRRRLLLVSVASCSACATTHVASLRSPCLIKMRGHIQYVSGEYFNNTMRLLSARRRLMRQLHTGLLNTVGSAMQCTQLERLESAENCTSCRFWSRVGTAMLILIPIPSVTLRCCVETTWSIIILHHSSPIVVFPSIPNIFAKFRRGHPPPPRGVEYKWGSLYEFRDFRPISGYMWQTIQNRATVTVER